MGWVKSRKRVRITLMCALTCALASAQVDAGSQGDAEVIVEWNEILETVMPGGLAPPRHYAMLHIAMFDAANAVDRRYTPYRARVWAPKGASPDLAAAHAAHELLSKQFPDPTAQAAFDAALKKRVDQVHPHQALAARHVGKAVATKVLAWRENDGWTTPPPAYSLPPIPGAYQPTSASAASFRQLQYTAPFALITATQYLPSAPAPLNSEQYAQDFNEVKTLGAQTSAVRTEEQTQLALSFASVSSRTSHWALWNHVARDVARERGLSLIETARLFALLNVSIHDGLQTSHTSKFVYGAWRPITAIQRATEDMNDATDADPSWKPLLSTPAYPSHAGNQACVGASAARALQLAFGGDDASFTAVWAGAPGHPDVSRTYASFWQMAQDQADSRIFGGIHFRFESLASQASCPKVSEYVFKKYMRPRW